MRQSPSPNGGPCLLLMGTPYGNTSDVWGQYEGSRLKYASVGAIHVPNTARGSKGEPQLLQNPLVNGSWVDAEHRGLQAGGGVVEMGLFDPQQGHPILPF